MYNYKLCCVRLASGTCQPISSAHSRIGIIEALSYYSAANDRLQSSARDRIQGRRVQEDFYCQLEALCISRPLK